MAHVGRYDHNNNYKKKSGQIPRFGEWEEANEMPITQYFENPRQAGLLHFKTNHNTSSSSTTCTSTSSSSSSSAEALKFASHHPPRPRHLHPHHRQTAGNRGPQRRVRDVSAQTDMYYVDVTGVKQLQNDVAAPISRPPKPVDEDLYKIPPHLIHASRKKRMPGFLACLVPCAS